MQELHRCGHQVGNWPFFILQKKFVEQRVAADAEVEREWAKLSHAEEKERQQALKVFFICKTGGVDM